jgi:hypothetical protein
MPESADSRLGRAWHMPCVGHEPDIIASTTEGQSTMSAALEFKVIKFEFTSDAQTEVAFDIEVSSNPDPGVIVYVGAAVGAEEPVVLDSSTRSGRVTGKVNIAKTRGLVGSGPGNKPVALTAYACWVYDKAQATNWIKANAAISAKAGEIYLR